MLSWFLLGRYDILVLTEEGFILIIGLHGKAGSGKDAIANAICLANSNYERFAFADPIRQACNVMFGWSTDKLKDFEFKESVDPVFNVTPREVMQLLGTEFGRSINPDLWVLILTNKIKDLHDVVITDVRFENEAEAIRELGGVIIHVVTTTPEATTSHSSHVSERGIERHYQDLIFYNEHTGLDILHEKTFAMLKTLEGIYGG